eukprot:5421129-Amphidinium_carterae.4
MRLCELSARGGRGLSTLLSPLRQSLDELLAGIGLHRLREPTLRDHQGLTATVPAITSHTCKRRSWRAHQNQSINNAAASHATGRPSAQSARKMDPLVKEHLNR